MAKTIIEIDISEINNIKVKCECGFAYIFPISFTKEDLFPKLCPNCNSGIPSRKIYKVIKAINDLKEKLKDKSFTFTKSSTIFETKPVKDQCQLLEEAIQDILKKYKKPKK